MLSNEDKLLLLWGLVVWLKTPNCCCCRGVAVGPMFTLGRGVVPRALPNMFKFELIKVLVKFLGSVDILVVVLIELLTCGTSIDCVFILSVCSLWNASLSLSSSDSCAVLFATPSLGVCVSFFRSNTSKLATKVVVGLLLALPKISEPLSLMNEFCCSFKESNCRSLA